MPLLMCKYQLGRIVRIPCQDDGILQRVYPLGHVEFLLRVLSVHLA